MRPVAETLCLQVVIGLLVGYAVAAIVTSGGKKFVTGEAMRSASPVTFIWLKTFPLGFYAPGLFPLLVGFVVTAVENIGDVTATAEASRLDVDVRPLPGFSQTQQEPQSC
jgi:NCS2 family nucleobase:cation symporter-2